MSGRINLDDVAISTPCRAQWADMSGSDRVRTCSMCKLHVYNLSDMTRMEAEELLSQESTDGFCLKLFRRPDGTILTRDCSIARRVLEQSVTRLRYAAAMLLSLFNIAPVWAQANGQLANISSVDRFGGFGYQNPALSLKNSETANLQNEIHSYEGEKADYRMLRYFNRALVCEELKQDDQALKAYEQSLAIIRAKNYPGDPKFSERVAARYSLLLRKMHAEAKAISIEREFALTAKKIKDAIRLTSVKQDFTPSDDGLIEEKQENAATAAGGASGQMP